jgi:hypothetical protein
MRLWRCKRRSDQPEPDGLSDEQPLEPEPEGLSDMQRLAYLLHRLADDIAAHGDDPHGWSRQVRQAGDLIGRGKPWGLGLFIKLFEEVGRPGDQPYPIPNPFTEQPFARTPTCDEAYRLAYDLEGAHWLEESRLRQPDRDIVLRPWREGGTGKAVVYEDGTVVATQDGDGGDPHLPHIKRASRPDEDPVAELAIRGNGLCAIYRHRCGREWLAARVHEHDPGLRLEQAPPRV